MSKQLKRKPKAKPVSKTTKKTAKTDSSGTITKDPIRKLKRTSPSSPEKINKTNISNKTNILQLVLKSSTKKSKLNRPTPKDKSVEDQGKKIDVDELQKEVVFREKEIARLFSEGRKRAGRKSKLTEAIAKDIEILARIGLSEGSIAESIKVDPSTLSRWIAKNAEFRNRLRSAKNEGKCVLVNSILGHGVKSWQATSFLLERLYRTEFAAVQKVELSGPNSGPITFTVKYEDKPASPEKKEKK